RWGHSLVPLDLELTVTPHHDTSSVTSSALTRSAFQCVLDPDTSDPTDHLAEQAVEFCQRVGSTATTVSEIVGTKDEAVYRAIEEGIQRVNRNAMAQPYHIQKWAVLERDFSVSGGELGPTMKLKRFTVLEKYKAIIDSFSREHSK
ncbi:long-chain-fatty-acid--CoA ligase ACSBG1-like, partial [Pteropus vampyrus]|uniref:Long-chain-fatty-acid--CoA ligase ACSBG1-like n=1 Tax=Pteropus vampyrus TaxID=132908 RepID=A0A6P6C679_PTEVA